MRSTKRKVVLDEKGKPLTPHKLMEASPPRAFITIKRVEPAGALQFIKLASGVTFVWRYTLNGKTRREVIGIYDSTEGPKAPTRGPNGFSVFAATKAAEAMAIEHVANLDRGGRPALKQAKAQAEEEAEKEKIAAGKFTLGALMYAYADYLEAQERISANDVRSITNLHIVGAFPELAETPANAIELEDVADMQRRLIEADKGRTSNKLRSYVRAAYEVAKSAKSDAMVPEAFKLFKIKNNPAAETKANGKFNRSDKEYALTTEAMKDYWRVIKDLKGFHGAVLRLHLLTGAQRIAQLVRLETQNIEEINGETIIKLYDGKGRPGIDVRLHRIPLIAPAVAALKEMEPEGTYAFSTDISAPKRPRTAAQKEIRKGDSHISPTTLSRWAQDEVAEAIAKGQIKEIKTFEAKHLRSGVETLLASIGVSDNDRGRLQSHGIGGVQNAHYNNHNYIKEIKSTLIKLHEALEA